MRKNLDIDQASLSTEAKVEILFADFLERERAWQAERDVYLVDGQALSRERQQEQERFAEANRRQDARPWWLRWLR